MCIYIERWFFCPLHESAGNTKEPARIPEIHEKTPWLSWEHGEPVSPGVIDRFGLTIPKDWTYVRHKIVSKIRCAAWHAVYCDIGPHETWYRLYSSCCPECSGGDRCTLSDQPYRTEASKHAPALQTEMERCNFDQAVDDYWGSFMVFQSSKFREVFPAFPTLERHENVTNMMQVFNFFNVLTCTEDVDHVVAHNGHNPDCDRCSNIRHSSAHNVVRAVLQQEAKVVWQNNRDRFTALLQLLERQEVLGDMRSQRRLEYHIQQDWLAEDMGQGGSPDHTASLAALKSDLLMLGPGAENAEKRGYDVPSWDWTIQCRYGLALRLGELLRLDLGLSSEFLNKLFEQLDTIMSPWLQAKLPGPALRAQSRDLTKLLVSGLDRLYDDDEWNPRFDREDDLVRILKQNRNALRIFAINAGRSTDSYLEPITISFTEARTREESCAICGDTWIQSANVPRHLGIVNMPCCKKPFHYACMKQHLRPLLEAPKCPMCRNDLREAYGWFGKDFQATLIPLQNLHAGFVDENPGNRRHPDNDEGGEDRDGQDFE